MIFNITEKKEADSCRPPLPPCINYKWQKQVFYLKGGGVWVVGAGGALSRPCPLLPSARCGGRSVNLNAAFSAQSESWRRPASLISPSPVLSFRTASRRRKSWTGSVLGFWTQRCQTHDAMSRRKLGSRPQHLSAIQGKRRMDTPGENTLEGCFVLLVCLFCAWFFIVGFK